MACKTSLQTWLSGNNYLSETKDCWLDTKLLSLTESDVILSVSIFPMLAIVKHLK